jgi:hypothetical protein
MAVDKPSAFVVEHLRDLALQTMRPVEEHHGQTTGSDIRIALSVHLSWSMVTSLGLVAS